ncbi:hypothetical protein ZEAMMB73_Zm00001d021713 [Zea mays]|uniref:DM2 domain-containing protein n=3 Tax=Zea mays TaxID=4577 RepID=A0A1D6IEF4_MAIZE|nr:hypothetical protein ZEAMMB73_Zm00001d021713 [Zea mays]
MLRKILDFSPDRRHCRIQMLHFFSSTMVLQAMVQMDVLVPTGDMTAVRRTAQFFLNSFQERLTAQRKEREMTTAELGFKKQLTKEEKFERRKQRLAAIGEDLLAIAADQPFRFLATFTFVVRAFSVLDGIGKGLDPRFHITEIAKSYAKELLRFNDAGVEIVVKASFNIWSKLLTYLYDSTSPKDCFSRCVKRHVYSSYDEFLRLHEDEFHASRSQESRRPKIVYQFVLVFLFVGMPDSNELMFNTEQPTYNFGAYKNSKLRKERRAQFDSIHVKSEAAARSCFAFRWIYLANGMWIRSRGNEPCSQNQAKKTDINCDATLKSLFGGRDKVGMLEISKLLSRDFPKISKLLWSMEPGMALW